MAFPETVTGSAPARSRLGFAQHAVAQAAAGSGSAASHRLAAVGSPDSISTAKLGNASPSSTSTKRSNMAGALTHCARPFCVRTERPVARSNAHAVPSSPVTYRLTASRSQPWLEPTSRDHRRAAAGVKAGQLAWKATAHLAAVEHPGGWPHRPCGFRLGSAARGRPETSRTTDRHIVAPITARRPPGMPSSTASPPPGVVEP